LLLKQDVILRASASARTSAGARCLPKVMTGEFMTGSGNSKFSTPTATCSQGREETRTQKVDEKKPGEGEAREREGRGACTPYWLVFAPQDSLLRPAVGTYLPSWLATDTRTKQPGKVLIISRDCGFNVHGARGTLIKYAAGQKESGTCTDTNVNWDERVALHNSVQPPGREGTRSSGEGYLYQKVASFLRYMTLD
jgi:hypothetical protein